MNTCLIVRILACALVVFRFSIAMGPTNPTSPVATVQTNAPSNSNAPASNLLRSTTPTVTAVQQLAEKELVVVSKNPEFFSYTLTGISIVLSLVTVLIGIGSGIGLTIVLKALRERKELELLRSSFDQEQKRLQEQLQKDYKQMTEALQRTVFGSMKLHRTKELLREALSMEKPSEREVYRLLQQTVSYPDTECLRLYAKALVKFETSVDIVRGVRNGILQFARNPVDSVSVTGVASGVSVTGGRV